MSALEKCLTIQGRSCETDACFHQEGYAAGLAVDNAMKCFISYEDTRSEALAGREVRFEAQSAGLGDKPRDVDGQNAAPSIKPICIMANLSPATFFAFLFPSPPCSDAS